MKEHWHVIFANRLFIQPANNGGADAVLGAPRPRVCQYIRYVCIQCLFVHEQIFIPSTSLAIFSPTPDHHTRLAGLPWIGIQIPNRKLQQPPFSLEFHLIQSLHRGASVGEFII